MLIGKLVCSCSGILLRGNGIIRTKMIIPCALSRSEGESRHLPCAVIVPDLSGTGIAGQRASWEGVLSTVLHTVVLNK